MSDPGSHLEYRSLRAPREDGAAMVEPPWERTFALLAANLDLRAGYDLDVAGRRLAELTREARRELFDAAVRWTSAYRDVDASRWDPAGKFFLAGHQPQLFHPGVWFKNFALDALARQHGAVAINLIVDSDTIKTSSVRVPGGSAAEPQVALIPFDESGPVVPFEERRILDRRTFREFGARAARQIAPLVPDPLVREYWPLAMDRAQEVEGLGACLAQSRHQWEGRWGGSTLEVPQSWVCQLPAFARFTVYLLAGLSRLRPIYNTAAAEYRRLHRIRSTAHPVPDLAVEGPWIEAPYWIWTEQDPRRRRLFVRERRHEIVLSDLHGLEVALPGGEAGRAAGRIAELPGQGIRLRCRALITTLWARLVLGDVFLHGIGGAKYDQVTDAVIGRFFGLTPPGFLVLSATLLLPILRQHLRGDEARRIGQRLRELDWHPETAIDGPPSPGGFAQGTEWSELAAAKTRWIATAPTPDDARTRCLEIRRLNRAMQPWVSHERQQLLTERSALAAALRAEAILGWREYAFCLYPGRSLTDFFGRLLPKTA